MATSSMTKAADLIQGLPFDADAYAQRLIEKGTDPAMAKGIAEKTAAVRSTTSSAAEPPLKRKAKAVAPVVKPPQKHDGLKELAEQAKVRAGAYDDPNATYQLPLWPESEVRAIPNHIARSSLFAPIGKKSGPRKRHNKAEIASRSDVSIWYTGPQLDMADCDVFMQSLQIARNAPLGDKVYFVRSELLSALNKSDAGAWYDWLHSSIERLTEGTLYIKTKGYVVGDPEAEASHDKVVGKAASRRPKGLHLIAGFDYDEERAAYWLIFDPRVLAMFQNNEFALVDWQARLRLEKRVDMAKWLQNYVATHEPGVHRIKIESLKAWCGYTSPLNKFREALEAAMRELERVGIISNAKINSNGTVSWTRLRQSL